MLHREQYDGTPVNTEALLDAVDVLLDALDRHPDPEVWGRQPEVVRAAIEVWAERFGLDEEGNLAPGREGRKAGHDLDGNRLPAMPMNPEHVLGRL